MKNYKGMLYGASTYCVIIGAIYVALAILGLLWRWCVIDVNAIESPLVYMLYLLFFRTESCEPTIRWEILIGQAGPNAQLPAETEVVHRTFIFLMAYLGLHAALIVSALYGLCGVNNSCLGRRSFPIFFVPWIVVLVATIVLDVLATVYYSIDAVHAPSVDGLMNLLEVKNGDAIRGSFEAIAFKNKFLPPIFMILATIKIVFFLVCNLVWVSVIAKGGYTASTYHQYLDQTRRNYENTMANVNPAFDSIRDEVIASKQHERQMEFINNDQSSIHEIHPSVNPSASAPHDRYGDTARIQAFVYPHQMSHTTNEKQNQPFEEPFKMQRPTSLAIPETPSSQQQPYRLGDRDIESRLSRFTESNGNVIKTNEPLKFDDIPDQQQSHMKIRVLPPVPIVQHQQQQQQPQPVNRVQSYKPQPPPKPHHNNRFSMQPSGNEPVLYRPDRMQNHKVERTSSNILRGQLPWSYTNPPEEITPKRAFSNLKEDEELPNVPIPDYTLHYGRKQRGNLSDSEDGSWKHQRY